MITSIRNLKYLIYVFIIFTITGCGGIKTKKIPGCIVETSIYSTPDMTFYSINDESSNGSYSSLKVTKDELFLCEHEKEGPMMDQCADYNYLGFIANKLPETITITFDGLAKKTKKWGLYTIDTGPSPTTYFRCYFYGHDKKKIIWVNTHQLMRMFKSDSDFKEKNISAFKILAFENRTISNWNCGLKSQLNTDSNLTKRQPEVLNTPLNEGVEIDS